MKKKSPKHRNQAIHKLVVLANLMTGVIDDLEADAEAPVEFVKKCKELLPFCEEMISDAYSVEKIRSTTYLSDLSNKVDTVIRKNYQFIDHE